MTKQNIFFLIFGKLHLVDLLFGKINVTIRVMVIIALCWLVSHELDLHGHAQYRNL